MFSQVSHIQEECFHDTKDVNDPKYLHKHPLNRSATQQKHIVDAMAAVRAAEPALNHWQVHAKAQAVLVEQAVTAHAAENSFETEVAVGVKTVGVTVRRRKAETTGAAEVCAASSFAHSLLAPPWRLLAPGSHSCVDYLGRSPLCWLGGS
jgi:hypothetical protein